MSQEDMFVSENHFWSVPRRRQTHGCYDANGFMATFGRQGNHWRCSMSHSSDRCKCVTFNDRVL